VPAVLSALAALLIGCATLLAPVAGASPLHHLLQLRAQPAAPTAAAWAVRPGLPAPDRALRSAPVPLDTAPGGGLGGGPELAVLPLAVLFGLLVTVRVRTAGRRRHLSRSAPPARGRGPPSDRCLLAI
jgi:hypothetical protein